MGLTVAGVVLAGLVVGQALRQIGVLQSTPTDKMAQAWVVLADTSAKRDTAAAARLARAALDQDPLQSTAISMLAVIDQQAGRKQEAATLMAAAARQSRRNDVADYYLFFHNMDARRYEQAVLHADALLRRKFITVGPEIYQRILMGAGDPSLVEALAVRLAKKPEWRPHFLDFANQRLVNSSSVFPIYEAMQRAGSGPTPAEAAPSLRRLLVDGKYDEAYRSLVVFLPDSTARKLTNVYDGRFEDWPEAPPFGWEFGDGVRGSIEPASAYDRAGKALMIDFDGRTMPKLPGQPVILTPGPYRLSGVVLTATPESAGRLAWIVSCGDKVIFEGPPAPDTKQNWVKFSGDFVVPQNCTGQRMELKATLADRRSNIEIWYDDLVIERIQSDN